MSAINYEYTAVKLHRYYQPYDFRFFNLILYTYCYITENFMLSSFNWELLSKVNQTITLSNIISLMCSLGVVSVYFIVSVYVHHEAMQEFNFSSIISLCFVNNCLMHL